MEASWWKSSKFWLMWAGYIIALAAWYASVKWLPIDSFNRLPDPWSVAKEWFSPNPDYGMSIFTPIYYQHIFYSVYRATASYVLAVVLGVPLGILMAWSPKLKTNTTTHNKQKHPNPTLAWIPLAILIIPGIELAVI